MSSDGAFAVHREPMGDGACLVPDGELDMHRADAGRRAPGRGGGRLRPHSGPAYLDREGPGDRGAEVRPERPGAGGLEGVAADPGRVLCDVPVPSGHSSLELALAIVESLVKNHGAVVTGTDIRAQGVGSITMRIPRSVRLGPPV